MAPTFSRLRDLIELAKPRITLLVLFTSAVGVWLAPGPFPVWRILAFLAATGGLVASANTLNCWVERDTDALMHRTRMRPLPAGRLLPSEAFVAGTAQGLVALVGLTLATNPLTAALGGLALASYVLVYTPLKRVTSWALVIGAVPGAIPPLMGWTAVTGTLAAPGLVLFGILFFWQLPHFIAISIYLKDDYARGGLQVLPLVRGEAAARRHLFVYTLALVAVSLAAWPLGVAGPVYVAVALALGAAFALLAWSGVGSAVPHGWARRVFLYSLVYLPLLIIAIVADAR